MCSMGCALYILVKHVVLNVSFYHIIVSNQDATGKLIYDIDFKTIICTTKKLIYSERYESADKYFQNIFIYILKRKMWEDISNTLCINIQCFQNELLTLACIKHTQVIEVNGLPYFNIGITCNPV